MTRKLLSQNWSKWKKDTPSHEPMRYEPNYETVEQFWRQNITISLEKDSVNINEWSEIFPKLSLFSDSNYDDWKYTRNTDNVIERLFYYIAFQAGKKRIEGNGKSIVINYKDFDGFVSDKWYLMYEYRSGFSQFIRKCWKVMKK